TRFSRDWSSDVCSSDLTIHIFTPFDYVKVYLEYTVFADLSGTLHQPYQQNLLKFPHHRFVTVQEDIFHQLHRNCTCPTLKCAFLDVRSDREFKCFLLKSIMLIEIGRSEERRVG